MSNWLRFNIAIQKYFKENLSTTFVIIPFE